MIYYLMVLAAVLVSSLSQVLLKRSATLEHKSVVYELLNWRVMTAYCILLMSVIVNIFAMRNGVQLKDMPVLTSLGYVSVPCFAYLFLREKVRFLQIISIILILIGLFIFYA